MKNKVFFYFTIDKHLTSIILDGKVKKRSKVIIRGIKQGPSNVQCSCRITALYLKASLNEWIYLKPSYYKKAALALSFWATDARTNGRTRQNLKVPCGGLRNPINGFFIRYTSWNFNTVCLQQLHTYLAGRSRTLVIARTLTPAKRTASKTATLVHININNPKWLRNY